VAWVLLLAQRKGGSGKTSLAVNLAGEATCAGLSVALVDCDCQASASRWALGRDVVDRLSREETVAALAGRLAPMQVGSPVPLAEAFRRCAREVRSCPEIVIVPSAPHCRLDDVHELTLRELPVDVVIVDSPPDVGAPVVRAAIREADAVLAPVVPECWGLEAAPEIVGALHDAKRHDLAHSIRFVVNLRQRRALHEAIETVLRHQFGEAVSGIVIPNAAQVSESAARGAPLSKFAPKCAPAKLIAGLWAEIESQRRAAKAA
jgi:chromosome partitioning protein